VSKGEREIMATKVGLLLFFRYASLNSYDKVEYTEALKCGENTGRKGAFAWEGHTSIKTGKCEC